MTIQGIGVSLGPAIGGWIAQELGYAPMFLILRGFAAVSVALWIVFATLLKPACVAKTEFEPNGMSSTSTAAGIV